MARLDISKVLFVFVLTSTLLGFTFLFGLYSGARKNAVYDAVVHVKETTTNAFGLVWHEAGILTGLEQTHFLAPAVYPGAEVTLNDGDPGDLILLSGFFEGSNELRLIRRNGEIVRRNSRVQPDHRRCAARLDDQVVANRSLGAPARPRIQEGGHDRALQ